MREQQPLARNLQRQRLWKQPGHPHDVSPARNRCLECTVPSYAGECRVGIGAALDMNLVEHQHGCLRPEARLVQGGNDLKIVRARRQEERRDDTHTGHSQVVNQGRAISERRTQVFLSATAEVRDGRLAGFGDVG